MHSFAGQWNFAYAGQGQKHLSDSDARPMKRRPHSRVKLAIRTAANTIPEKLRCVAMEGKLVLGARVHAYRGTDLEVLGSVYTMINCEWLCDLRLECEVLREIDRLQR